jgi:group I intron endonuclease
MNKGGIYRLYWDNNDYYYYGQAVDLQRRKGTHKESASKNKHRNPKIQAIVNKYGMFKFQIIVHCRNEHLDFLEQRYIDEHFGNQWCCNICPTASSSKGRVYTGAVLEAMRERAKNRDISGDKNPFYGKTHSKETRSKISLTRVGKKYPKLSEAKKGIIASQETKDKLSKAKSYGGAPKAKIVLDTYTGVYYSCAKEVSDLYNITYSTLRSMLNGRNHNKTPFIYT